MKKTKIISTPIIKTIDDARKEGRKCGNIFGRILYGRSEMNIIERYIENKIVTFEIEYVVPKLKKMLTNYIPNNQLIKVFFEGSNGTPSVLEEEVDMVEMEVDCELIQISDISDIELERRCKRMLMKLLKRRTGNNVLLKIKKIESIFRPYYICIYGDIEEDSKVRYTTISADKYKIFSGF